MRKIFMNRGLIAGFSLLTVFFASLVFAENLEGPWQLRLQKDGVTVYTRTIEGSPMRDFKSDIIVSAPIDQVVALYENEKRVPEWYHQAVQMDFVADEGDSKIFYFVLNLPWPVAKRDSVFRRVKTVDVASGVVNYELSALPERLPKEKGKIRVPYLKANWRLTPVEGNKTAIYFQQHSDPGGSVPAFLANALVVDIPFNSLRAFRKIVEQK